MKRIQTTTVNTFKSNLYVNNFGELKQRVMSKEKESLQEVREFWTDQLRTVQLHLMSFPDYVGKYDLSAEKQREMDNLYLLKEMDTYKSARRERRQVRIAFAVAMTLLLTALAYIVNARA